MDRSKVLSLILIILTLACNLVTEGADSSISIPELELYGNIHSMGVVVTLPGNIGYDEHISSLLEYRSGNDAYRQGFQLSWVNQTRSVSSLFWLEPSTVYTVRVSFNDPKGGPLDGVILTATNTTRPEPD